MEYGQSHITLLWIWVMLCSCIVGVMQGKQIAFLIILSTPSLQKKLQKFQATLSCRIGLFIFNRFCIFQPEHAQVLRRRWWLTYMPQTDTDKSRITWLNIRIELSWRFSSGAEEEKGSFKFQAPGLWVCLCFNFESGQVSDQLVRLSLQTFYHWRVC